MPWTEKQLRLFRAAAHNPEIAKRTGIKQSDAERMSKEGLKKMAVGGEAKQKILRQDTRHGKVDMPFEKLSRFSGMKKGGVMKKSAFMKKRRFDEGGDVDDLEQAGYSKEGEGEDTVYRKSFATGVSSKNSASTPAKKPAKSVSDDGSYDRKEMRERPKYEDTSGTMARTPRSMGFRREAPSDAQKDINADRFAKELALTALGGGVGQGVRGVYRAEQAAKAAREAATRYAETPAIRAMSEANKARFAEKQAERQAAQRRIAEERDRMFGSEAAARRYAEASGMKKGGSVMRSKKDIGRDQMGMAPYRKGGEMESKAMVKKEIGFMKKKGAPASMIKHEKAEMRGMKKGGHLKETMGPRGMGSDVEGGYKAKHLKHGEHSEQKRGHTRGTIVKMAAGGFVRSADGVAQRGKTKGRMC